MPTWSVTRTRAEVSTSKSLSQWGIGNAIVSLRSLATSELTFRIKRADVLTDPDFEHDDVVSLKYGSTQRFYGKVKKLPAIGKGGAESEEFDTYTVECPWGDLGRLNYIQPRQIANVTGLSVVNYSAVDTSQVTLGAQATDGELIPFGTQIRNIIAFAVTYGVQLQQGTVPVFRTIPIDVGRDIMCSEAIKRCLSYQPDAVSWFDFSTTPPTLNIQARSALSEVEIDVTDADLIQEFSVTPRHDLVPTGVIFNYLTTEEVTELVGEETVTRTVDKVTPDSSGAAFGLNVLVATIELSRTNTGEYEDAPTGLALYYYTQLSLPHYQGTIRLKGVDSPTTLEMGKVLNLASGRSAWSTMKGLIQTAVYDLDEGTAEFEFGPPEHLSPQDFVNLLLFNRRQQMPSPKSGFPGIQPTPDPGNPNPTPGGPSNPGGGQMKEKQIKVCLDGTLTDITVYGP